MCITRCCQHPSTASAKTTIARMIIQAMKPWGDDPAKQVCSSWLAMQVAVQHAGMP